MSGRQQGMLALDGAMFDARSAALLKPGMHLLVQGCPGLRLEASEKYRSWTYRYRSPLDNKLKQAQLGRWPAMSLSAAVASWSVARGERAEGHDVIPNKRTRWRPDVRTHREVAGMGATDVMFLDLSSVAMRVTLSETTLKRLVRLAQFPPPRVLSGHRVAWLLSDVIEWCEARPASKIASPPRRRISAKR